MIMAMVVFIIQYKELKMPISTYAANKVLDHITGDSAFAIPTVWVGLSTANPGKTGSGLAEPSGVAAYARVVFAGLWANASNGSKSNDTEVTFTEATGDWGTITYFALFDADTAGNMLWYGTLTQAKIIVSGDTPKFDIGSFVLNAT